MSHKKMLADLGMAAAIVANLRRQLPEKSRFSNEAQEVEQILNCTIKDIAKSDDVIDRKKVLEVTQVLRLFINLLSLVKDLFNFCFRLTFGWLYGYYNTQTTNW